MPADLFGSPVVTVAAGLPSAVFDALRADPSRDVTDGNGTTLGRLVAPPAERGGGAVARRVLGAFVTVLKPTRRWEVLDASGAVALTLVADSRDLTVSDGAGRRLGGARNVSRISGPPDIAIEVRAADGRVLTFGGPGDQESFDHEVRGDHGPVARLANAHDATYRLTVEDGLDADLRALLVGILCGLVERRWWRLPERQPR